MHNNKINIFIKSGYMRIVNTELLEHFGKLNNKEEINKSIIKALNYVYKKLETVRYLKIRASSYC